MLLYSYPDVHECRTMHSVNLWEGINMNRKISRRDFLQGAAASAVGVAAMGMLSACGNTSGSAANSAAEAVTITPDVVDDCDVVVVGVGVAGISACIEAAEAGAKVIGIDRAVGVVGTNAVSTVGIYGIADPSEISEHFRQMTAATYYEFKIGRAHV